MKRIHLKAARTRAKLTQQALARRIGKPQSFISKLENGTITDPSFETAKALARALHLNPLQLEFGSTVQSEVA